MLCIPATSAPAERLFPQSGLLLGQNRASPYVIYLVTYPVRPRRIIPPERAMAQQINPRRSQPNPRSLECIDARCVRRLLVQHIPTIYHFVDEILGNIRCASTFSQFARVPPCSAFIVVYCKQILQCDLRNIFVHSEHFKVQWH